MTFEEAHAAEQLARHEQAARDEAEEKAVREQINQKWSGAHRTKRCPNEVIPDARKFAIDFETRLREHARLEAESPKKLATREEYKSADNAEMPGVFDEIVRLGVWLEVAEAQKKKIADWIASKQDAALELCHDLKGVHSLLMDSFETAQKQRLAKHLKDFCEEGDIQQAVEQLYPLTNLQYRGELPTVDYIGERGGQIKRFLDCIERIADAFARAKIPLPPGAECLKRK